MRTRIHKISQKEDFMTEQFYNAISVFPEDLKSIVKKAGSFYSSIYEIRLVAGVSSYFLTPYGIRFITEFGDAEASPMERLLIPTFSQLREICDRAMGFSGFLYEKELNQGFITYGGGCRMGICNGEDCISKGSITSVAIRIPASGEIKYTYDDRKIFGGIEGGLLIAGAPSSGKTTLLRYIAKKLSDGILGEYKKVTVVDERGELSDGFYLGLCTDVLRGKKKAEGVLQALRLLSPNFVICDEIGFVEETYALLEGLNSGVTFIASMHGKNIDELIHRKQFRILFDENVFSRVLFLSEEKPGEIISLYDSEEIKCEIFRAHGNLFVS